MKCLRMKENEKCEDEVKWKCQDEAFKNEGKWKMSRWSKMKNVKMKRLRMKENENVREIKQKRIEKMIWEKKWIKRKKQSKRKLLKSCKEKNESWDEYK